jgi:prepilin-type N-terminal cleavage/methylation domain-containing protein
MRKKGFTLIELLIALALTLIVLSTIYPIFSSNYNTLNQTEIKSDLQSEAQYVLGYFTKSSMEAQNIVILKDEGGTDELSTSSAAISISQIEFATGNIDQATNGSINYNFTLQNRELSYTKKISGQGISNVLSQDVQSIQIQAIDGNSFDKCSGITIILNMMKNSINYSVKSNIYFRNFSN